MTHRYYFLSRPPMYGTLPRGFTNYEQWYPAHSIPDFLVQHRFLGWAEYPEPLGMETIWNWELMPADPKELIEFYFYRECNRSEKEGMKFLMEYVNLPVYELQTLAGQMNDFLCVLALEYKIKFTQPPVGTRWLMKKQGK
jgi:hypothetical protein